MEIELYNCVFPREFDSGKWDSKIRLNGSISYMRSALCVGNPIKWKLCAKFPDLDKSSSGKLLVGKWPHLLPCHMLSNSVWWKWEVGNGKCLQLGLLLVRRRLRRSASTREVGRPIEKATWRCRIGSPGRGRHGTASEGTRGAPAARRAGRGSGVDQRRKKGYATRR